ncbi:FUSC family protein [Dyella sp. C11]|uniref:FUSC family protein n=1 Tax=Dyella sp. C11 TaxID=2126991 RepID=UPI000D65215F|nr:FUSC family protein [Dyella sp. C11]
MRSLRDNITANFHEQLSGLAQLGSDLLRDLRTLAQPGPRMVDQVEAMASVLLAIALAQLVGTQNIGWAAFSGFMVIRSHLAASTQRAVLRVIGTLLGALAGWAVATGVAGHLAIASLSLLLAVTFTMYMALVSRRTYAWLFSGLTFVMVVVESGVPHAAAPAMFAKTRVTEIVLGTTAGLFVSYLSSKTLRRWVPGQRPSPVTSYRQWHPRAAWHALQAGLAAACIPLFSTWVSAPALIQAGITVMAVMLVPLASLEDAKTTLVSRRMVHRFIGCSAGALLAMAILLTCHSNPLMMTAGVCVGVAIGRHIENGPARYSYIGVQFALAFLVVLVPDNYAQASIKPGMERLSGILMGFALLLVIRPGFRLFKRWLQRRVATRLDD